MSFTLFCPTPVALRHTTPSPRVEPAKPVKPLCCNLGAWGTAATILILGPTLDNVTLTNLVHTLGEQFAQQSGKEAQGQQEFVAHVLNTLPDERTVTNLLATTFFQSMSLSNVPLQNVFLTKDAAQLVVIRAQNHFHIPLSKQDLEALTVWLQNHLDTCYYKKKSPSIEYPTAEDLMPKFGKWHWLTRFFV